MRGPSIKAPAPPRAGPPRTAAIDKADRLLDWCAEPLVRLIRQYSVRDYQAGMPTAHLPVFMTEAEGVTMCEPRNDWKRWSPRERVVAVVLWLLLVGLPLAVWI